MPVPAIITAGLVRLGYKVAEKKSWLPEFVYHNMSVNELKQGDPDKARVYNSIAIRKNPKSEKALVMRDILQMQHDSAITAIEKKIQAEVSELDSLEQTARKTDRSIRKWAINRALVNTLFLLGVFGYIAGMIVWAAKDRSTMFYIVFISGSVVLGGLLLYYRLFGVHNDVRRIIIHQEQVARAGTIREEMEAHRKRLNKLQSQLEQLIGKTIEQNKK